MSQDHIRNFAIIAHIDHGKSTLADRLLELTHTVEMRDMSAQLLDSNPIERERGITIKLAPVRMKYKIPINNNQYPNNNQNQNKDKETNLEFGASDLEVSNSEYVLNLIDTPGHVDFSYEVSRSLAACEGAILVVDATQGIQAQTLANLHQARNHKLRIIPVLNKIDLPNARIDECLVELTGLGFDPDEVIQISAKTGKNVPAVLEAIVLRIPPPIGDPDKPLRALVFSSQYDTHKGVVVFVRIVDGSIGMKKDAEMTNNANTYSHDSSFVIHNSTIRFMASNAEVNPIEVGYFMPKMVEGVDLHTGEVGYIATGLKDIRFAKVGDTITVAGKKVSVLSSQFSDRGQSGVSNSVTDKLKTEEQEAENRQLKTDNVKPLKTDNVQPLEGYKEPKSMVFLGLFPISSDEFQDAREAMEKLRLSDSAFTFRPISSLALGNGFHCGFLGLLHAEVVQERLLREFDLTMLATAPSVEYRIKLRPGVNAGKAGLTQLSVLGDQLSDAGLSDISQSDTDTLKTEEQEAENRQLKTDTHKPIPEIWYSIQSASEYPDPSVIEEVKEPVMQLSLYSPKRYVGAIMTLCQEKRAEYIDLAYVGEQAQFTYLIPLSEMIVDFFDRLKSATEGYASLDYEFFDYQRVQVAKLDILVNKEKVDAFASLVVTEQAHSRGKDIAERLAAAIPKQQFEVPIQAAIGGTVIARADVKAFRKDVIAKLYGGDRTRKDKLLNKQKKGKAKMKMIGRVEIPQAAFFAVLKRE